MVDTTNGWLGAMAFDDSKNLLNTMPPIELARVLKTGRQTFTGLDMPASFPFEGNPLLNAVAMNSPLSRIFTTYRALGRNYDTGNYLPAAAQFFAGPRITNVDPAAAQRSAVRQLADQQLGTQPEFSRFERLSVRPGQLPNLTPEELQLLQLYNAVNRRQAPAR